MKTPSQCCLCPHSGPCAPACHSALSLPLSPCPAFLSPCHLCQLYSHCWHCLPSSCHLTLFLPALAPLDFPTPCPTFPYWQLVLQVTVMPLALELPGHCSPAPGANGSATGSTGVVCSLYTHSLLFPPIPDSETGEDESGDPQVTQRSDLQDETAFSTPTGE